jgi:lipoprotein-anchoring transpeptidase ErfK/SrfK
VESDIYLERRKRSRAGCLAALAVLAAMGALAGGYAAWKWWEDRKDYAGDVPFPDAPIEEPEVASLPDAPPPPAGTEGLMPDPPPVAPPEIREEKAEQPEKEAETPKAPEKPQPDGTPSAAAPAENGGAPDSAAEPPDGETAAKIKSLLSQANGAKKKGNLQKAREKALEALSLDAGNGKAEEFLSEIAMPLLASQAPMAEKTVHTVATGDTLGGIAAKYNCPVALIRKINGVKGDNIRLGYDLTVFDGSKHVFAVAVDRKRNTLVLTIDGTFFKRYTVGTGRDNGTPLGEYKIVEKVEHPVWWRDDGTSIPYTGEPGENELGTHWLALNLKGYGLHGTWEPESVGSQSSAGCIRLRNEEIEELFSILPRGTVVTVTE